MLLKFVINNTRILAKHKTNYRTMADTVQFSVEGCIPEMNLMITHEVLSEVNKKHLFLFDFWHRRKQNKCCKGVKHMNIKYIKEALRSLIFWHMFNTS